MRRRDRQNELVVALIVTVAMGFALVFGIVLSLQEPEADNDDSTPTVEGLIGNPTDLSDVTEIAFVTEEPTQDATENATEALPETMTSEPTELVTEEPTATLTPSTTAHDFTKTPTSTLTDTPTVTLTPTNTYTNTSTITPSDTATERPTRTPRPSRTLTPTPTQTSTYTNTPTITPSFTLTDIPPTSTTVALAVFPTATPTECAPRTDWVTYMVERGDTLFSIALLAEIGLQELADANCILDTSQIFAGQTLRVPQDISDVTQDAFIEGCDLPTAVITEPRSGAEVNGVIELSGIASGEGFRRYIIDWRPDESDVDFQSFEEVFTAVETEGVLGTFNTDAFTNGTYFFRLRVLETNDFIIGECIIAVEFR